MSETDVIMKIVIRLVRLFLSVSLGMSVYYCIYGDSETKKFVRILTAIFFILAMKSIQF